MRSFFAYAALAVLAFLLPAGVAAQPLDAARYVNPQGVEVIQGRQGAQPAAPAPLPAAVPPRERARGEERFRISAAQQRERDRDRLAILNEEMMHEVSALQAKGALLAAQDRRARLPDEGQARVREAVRAHEANIRALHAEIGRVQAGAGGK